MEKIILSPVFFTATIRNWKNLLKPEKYKIIILENLQTLVSQNKIILFAYCIMNNHIHLIWQVKSENNPSDIQKIFLEGTSKQIKKDLELNHTEVLKFFISSQKDSLSFLETKTFIGRAMVAPCLSAKIRLHS